MKEAIINAAEALFMAQGYQATSTRQIAESLGITQPNLYYHFKKKEDIYYAVMESLSEEVEENLVQLSHQDHLPLHEKLFQMIEYLQKRHPFNFYMMMHDIRHTLSKEIADKLYLLWQESYQKPFVDLFQHNKKNLRANIAPTLIVKQMYILLASYLEPQKENPRQNTQLKAAIDLFLYGVISTKN